MRNSAIFILTFIGLYSAAIAAPTIIDGDVIRGRSNEFVNFAKNSIPERNLNGYTTAGTNATWAFDSSAGNKLQGFGSIKVTFSGASSNASVIGSAMTTNDNVTGTCELSAMYKGSDGANWRLAILDGSSNELAYVQLSNESAYKKASLYYPCATGYKIKVYNSASTSTQFNIGDFYWGKVRGVGTTAQATIIGSTRFAAAASCDWVNGATTGSFVDFGTDSDCASPTNSGLATSASKLPQITFASLPPGDYEITASGVFYVSATTQDVNFALTDGTTQGPITYARSTTAAVGASNITMKVSYSTPQTNPTFKVQVKQTATSAGHIGVADGAFEIVVKRFPTSSEIVQNVDKQAQSWSGYHTVASGWTTTSTTYADPAAGNTVVLTERANTNFGTVTTAASSLPGITFTPSKAGNVYHVCASLTAAGSAISSPSFRLITGGSVVIASGSSTSVAGSNYTVSWASCGQVVATSTSALTVKVQSASDGAPTITIKNGNASTSAAIEWSIVNISSGMQTVIVSPSAASAGGTKNFVYNSSGSDGTNGWTLTNGSGSGAFVQDTTAANGVAGSIYSLKFTAAGSGDYITSSAMTLDNELTGNCELSMDYKSASSVYSLALMNGSTTLNTLALPVASTYQKATMNYPCGSGYSVRVTASGTASSNAINFGNVYFGKATNVTFGQNVGPWTSFTPTGTWSTNTTYTGSKRRNGDSLDIMVHVALSGAPTGTFTINIPDGLSIDTTKIPSSLGAFGAASTLDNGVGRWVGVVGFNNSTSVFVAAESNANSWSATTPYSFGSGDTIDLFFTVPIQGWSSEYAVRADQSAWYINANIAGANTSLGTSTVSSYTEITDASYTLTKNTGSADVQIACASGTASSGTTCGATNESQGIAFSIPSAGTYRACASLSHQMGILSTGNAYTAFQVVETTNTSSAVVSNGNTRFITGGRNDNASISIQTYPMQVCGVFNFSSSGQKTLRLEYTQVINAGTINNSTLIIDGATGSGGTRDAHWEVYPVTSQSPAPLLVGGLTTSSQGLEISNAAQVSNGSGAACTGTCTIDSQSGSWLTSVTRSGIGTYTLNFAAGVFSAAPKCRFTPIALTQTFQRNGTPSASSYGVIAATSNTGSAADSAFEVQCQGPR